MRVIITIVFVGLLGFGFWTLVKNTTASTGTTAVSDSNVSVATRHENAVRELSDALEDSRRHAAEAEKIADRLDTAIRNSRETSRDIVRIGTDFEIIETSINAVREASARGDITADVMRLYANRVDEELTAATSLSQQAVEIADAIEKIEVSQREAQEAVVEARQIEDEISGGNHIPVARQTNETPYRDNTNTRLPTVRQQPDQSEDTVHVIISEPK